MFRRAGWRAQSVLGALVIVAAARPGAAAPLVLDPGTYRLHNHPDAELAPPGYGLRLDELIDATGGNDRFTFSFDHPGADMELLLTPIAPSIFSINISGTAYGGRVVNHQYDPTLSGPAVINFTYMMVHPVPGDDDLIVTTATGFNHGTILFQGTTFNLIDKANEEGFTFRLGNENDDQGHRGFDGVSGWGWLAYDSGSPGTLDWIFTVEVPGPGGMPMLVTAALLGRRRRRPTA